MKQSQIESYRKSLLVKIYEWYKGGFTHWFEQKRVWRGVLKIDGRTAPLP